MTATRAYRAASEARVAGTPGSGTALVGSATIGARVPSKSVRTAACRGWVNQGDSRSSGTAMTDARQRWTVVVVVAMVVVVVLPGEPARSVLATTRMLAPLSEATGGWAGMGCTALTGSAMDAASVAASFS